MKLLAEIQALLKPKGLVFLFTGGQKSRIHCPPQLTELISHPLLASVGSRLEILQRKS